MARSQALSQRSKFGVFDRQGDRVALRRRADSPAVQDNQQHWFSRHRHSLSLNRDLDRLGYSTGLLRSE